MITETRSESDAANQTTPAKAIDPKRRYLCRHIHASGHRCTSPALRGKNLCFYHRASHQGPPISVGRTPATAIFEMPPVDDRPGIQLALHSILARIASCDIDTKRAGLLLYGLQIASANLPRHAQSDTTLQPQVDEVIYDPQLGELAPITEIPDPDVPTSVPTSGAPCSTASPSTMGLQPTEAAPPTEVVILSGAKNPRISPEPPQQSAAQPPTPDPPPSLDSQPPQPGRLTLIAANHTAQTKQPSKQSKHPPMSHPQSRRLRRAMKRAENAFCRSSSGL